MVDPISMGKNSYISITFSIDVCMQSGTKGSNMGCFCPCCFRLILNDLPSTILPVTIFGHWIVRSIGPTKGLDGFNCEVRDLKFLKVDGSLTFLAIFHRMDNRVCAGYHAESSIYLGFMSLSNA